MSMVGMHDHRCREAGGRQEIDEIIGHPLGQHDREPGMNPKAADVGDSCQPLDDSLQAIIAQDLVPSADRTRRLLAYELLVATGAVRNIIRENHKHMLENAMQTGAKDGMQLMDASLFDLYSQALITYDTALNRAFNPDRIAKRAATGNS